MPKPSYLTPIPSIEGLAVLLSGKTDLSAVDLQDWSTVVRKKYANFPTVTPFSCPIGWSDFVVILHPDDQPDFIDKKAKSEFSSITYDSSLKKITLVNDQDSVPANYVYAQNGSGQKGWYSWETVLENSGGISDASAHALLGSMHEDTEPGDPTKNAIIIGKPNNKWAKLEPPSKLRVLVNNKGTIGWGVIPAINSITAGDPWPRLVTANGVPNNSWDDGRYYYGTNNAGTLGFWKWSNVDCDEKPEDGPRGGPGGGGPVQPEDQCSCNVVEQSNGMTVYSDGVDFYFYRICSNNNLSADSLRLVESKITVRAFDGPNCSGSSTLLLESDVQAQMTVTLQNNGVKISIRGSYPLTSQWISVPNGGSMCVYLRFRVSCGTETLTMEGSDYVNKSNTGDPVVPNNCDGFSAVLGTMYYQGLRLYVVVEFSRCLQPTTDVQAPGAMSCSNGQGFPIGFSATVPNDGQCRRSIILQSVQEVIIPNDVTCNVCIESVSAVCNDSGQVARFNFNQCYRISGNNGPDNPAVPVDNPGQAPGAPIDGIGPLGGGDGAGPFDPDDNAPIAGGDGVDGGGGQIPNPELLPVPNGAPQGGGLPDGIRDPKNWKAPNVVAGGRINVKVIKETRTVTLPWFQQIGINNVQVVKSVFHPESRWRALVPEMRFTYGSFTEVMGNNQIMSPHHRFGQPHPDKRWADIMLRNAAFANVGQPAFVYRYAPEGGVEVDLGKHMGYVSINVAIKVPDKTLKDFKFGTRANPQVAVAERNAGEPWQKQGNITYIVTVNGLAFLVRITRHGGEPPIHLLANAYLGSYTATGVRKALSSLGRIPSVYWFSIILPIDEGASSRLWNPFQADDNVWRVYGNLEVGFPTFGLYPYAVQFLYPEPVNEAETRTAIAQKLPPLDIENGLQSGMFNQIKSVAIYPVMIFAKPEHFAPQVPVWGSRSENNPAATFWHKIKKEAGEPPVYASYTFVDNHIPLIGVGLYTPEASGPNFSTNSILLLDDPMSPPDGNHHYCLYKVPLDFYLDNDAQDPKQKASDFTVKGEAPKISIRYTVRAVYF